VRVRLRSGTASLPRAATLRWDRSSVFALRCAAGNQKSAILWPHINGGRLAGFRLFLKRGLAAQRAPIPFIRRTSRALLIGIGRFHTTDARPGFRLAVCELRVAGRAELLLVAFQAGFNSGRARNIRRTQSKSVSHTGRCLLAGTLRVRRCRHRQHRARERQHSDGHSHPRSRFAHRNPHEPRTGVSQFSGQISTAGGLETCAGTARAFAGRDKWRQKITMILDRKRSKIIKRDRF
jgi:hypothetical protein